MPNNTKNNGYIILIMLLSCDNDIAVCQNKEDLSLQYMMKDL